MDTNFDYSGQNIGKYFLEKKLGSGSFGAVYCAIDRVLNSRKAIKILAIQDPERAHELFTEAEIPYKCQHPNIVKIHNGTLELFEGRTYFVIDMELVNGGSLESCLYPHTLSTIDSVSIAKNILFGLQHAHLNGVIHRDIKPANILLHNKLPKISDFGLSTSQNTQINPWKWYYTHAAPETFTNSIATVTTDIFAFGMTLYRMLNHIADWRSFIITIKDFNNLISSGKLINHIPFSQHIPLSLVRIIKKACNISPLKRYQSAIEMRNALERLRPRYSWISKGSWLCIGSSYTEQQKCIAIENRRFYVEFVVKSGLRRTNLECRKFETNVEAEAYFLNYIAKTSFY